jgi:cyclopropane-fatty-acyl-phospholipid synthase
MASSRSQIALARCSSAMERLPAAQLAPTWPSLEAMTHVLHRHTSLGISSDFAMGEQYARTLREWRARFLAATDDIGQLGFGRAFPRMRDLYLAYSEAGFRSG